MYGLMQFPIAQIHITCLFDLVQKNLHNVILCYRISVLCKFFDKFFHLFFDLCSANFALRDFLAATISALI